MPSILPDVRTPGVHPALPPWTHERPAQPLLGCLPRHRLGSPVADPARGHGLARRGAAGGDPEPHRRHGRRQLRRRAPLRAGLRGAGRGHGVRRPVPRPRALLAALQPARPRARRGHLAAAAGAGAVPGDLRQQPRRVLHGARRRPQAAHRRRRRRARRQRADAARGARADLADRRRADGQRHARVFADDVVPALVERGHRARALGRPATARSRRPARSSSRTASSPCSRRWRSTRRTRSPTSPGSRSTSPSSCATPTDGKEHFARVKVPPIFSRFVPVGHQRFVPLEDVICEHLKRLFPGMEVLGAHTFRVTRNEDLEVEEDDAENLLAALEKELLRRRFGPPVRLEVEESIDPKVLELLVSELGVSEDEVVTLPGPLDLRGLHDIADLPREELKYPAFVPTTHRRLAEVESASPVDVFKAARRHDVLLHHPYDSFATSVQRFIEQAAADPHVLAIKQTLYRTSGDSPIIDALVDAAEAGKQVLVIVEIKARFDEQANIRWARKLEQAGCHVVYGLVGLKTHCKLSMVVRDEPDGIRRYTHIGTGNYNPKTARLYEDLGLHHHRRRRSARTSPTSSTTCRATAATPPTTSCSSPRTPCATASSSRSTARSSTTAPAGPRGSGSRPTPSSTRPSSTRSTSPPGPACPSSCWCAASARCGPACPGCRRTSRCARCSGRFLEHSRVFWFDNGGEPEAWIGSADMMHRNLDRRVEVLVRLRRRARRGRSAAPRPRLRRRHLRLAARSPTASGATPQGVRAPAGGPDRAAAAAPRLSRPRDGARRRRRARGTAGAAPAGHPPSSARRFPHPCEEFSVRFRFGRSTVDLLRPLHRVRPAPRRRARLLLPRCSPTAPTGRTSPPACARPSTPPTRRCTPSCAG